MNQLPTALSRGKSGFAEPKLVKTPSSAVRAKNQTSRRHRIGVAHDATSQPVCQHHGIRTVNDNERPNARQGFAAAEPVKINHQKRLLDYPQVQLQRSSAVVQKKSIEQT